ncbi:MAG: hypothetical protein FWF75_08660, partial [Propionibacteriaceae bacterium]|nr:hypothetical protein [Propionibacteriaceae bacterium]
MAIVGSAPHPRILFVGWAEDDPGLQEMTELIPTWKIWDGNLQSIRWADWDALVSCQKFDYPDPFSHPTQHRMPVLAFPHSTLPMCRTANEQLMSVYPDALKQPSTEMEINDILPAPLKQLVQREMIPWLQKLPERPLLEHTYSTPSGFCTRGFQTDMDGNSPYWFVRDADHVMIAGAYRTRHNESVWWIPFIPDYPAEWLSAAMEAWSTELPDQFPPRSPWRTQPRWMTRDELRTTEEITQKEAALRALTSERQEEIAQLQSKLSG